MANLRSATIYVQTRDALSVFLFFLDLPSRCHTDLCPLVYAQQRFPQTKDHITLNVCACGTCLLQVCFCEAASLRVGACSCCAYCACSRCAYSGRSCGGYCACPSLRCSRCWKEIGAGVFGVRTSKDTDMGEPSCSTPRRQPTWSTTTQRGGDVRARCAVVLTVWSRAVLSGQLRRDASRSWRDDETTDGSTRSSDRRTPHLGVSQPGVPPASCSRARWCIVCLVAGYSDVYCS